MPETVSSENFHFWLTSLQLIAQAEQVVSQDGNNKPVHLRLMSAGSSYVQAVNTLKVRFFISLIEVDLKVKILMSEFSIFLI